MKNHTKNIIAAALAISLVGSAAPMPVAATDVPKRCEQIARKKAQGITPNDEELIEERDCTRRGITVEEPKVYDDALLQQMLQAAEARLAAIQLFDQTGIAAKFGAVTGASQQISSFGLNVQGPSLPEMTTASKGATGSSETTNTGFKTVAGLATEDVTTKRSQVNPPPVTAPAPSTSLPTTFSVSASDVLNEQAQLTAEIAALRLLIRGSLSDHFVKGTSASNRTKKKLTLGFPVTLLTDRRYKDAVAVVEVEVEPSEDKAAIKKRVEAEVQEEEDAKEPKERLSAADKTTEINRRVALQLTAAGVPVVTTLLPREKTYNVASITDKSVSIGGGVATQLLGVSGSWLTGRKTYYLVQDQDTVALSFTPQGDRKVGFIWQFRPVLGREYVKLGLKQTFVQLAFNPTGEETVGRVTVRTYWRRYDRKKGITGEIIPGSLRSQYASKTVEAYTLAKRPPSFNSLTDLEDIGGGQVMVRVVGRFLPGTYVRIGSTMLPPGPQLTHEHEGIRFIAPVNDLMMKHVAVVAHDGSEALLKFRGEDCATPITIATVGSKSVIKIEPVDDSTSRLTVEVNEDKQETQRPQRVIVVGQRVFGFSDSPILREGKTLSAVVPNSLLNASPRPEVSVRFLFAQKSCLSDPVALPKPASPERLAVLERRDDEVVFLLSGSRASDVEVISPAGAKKGALGLPGEKEKLTTLTLSNDHIKTNKQVLLQRKGERPFLVNIPDIELKKPDPPKAKERVTVDSDEAVIEGDGMKDLVKVTFKGTEITQRDVAGDGKSVRLSGLRRLGVTSAAATQALVLEFKSGAKATVNLEVVNTKVETVTK